MLFHPPRKSTLKVLDIGNSYSIDATALLPLIANNSGSDLSDICLYRCYRNAASFKLWYNIYNDRDSVETYNIVRVLGNLPSTARTGTGNKGDGSLLRQVLNEETWDLILIHQVSSYAPYYELWNSPKSSGGYLDSLLSVIKTAQPDASIGMLLVHSVWSGYRNNTEGSSLLRWQKIAESTRRFCEDYGVDFVIPYGTAIQNLRASSWNNEYDLTRDGTHCGVGLAQYTAACCYYEALIAPRSGISVLGNSARYDASTAPSYQYPSVSVTDENALVAQEAAVLAVKDWYALNNPEEHIHWLVYIVDGEVYKRVSMAEGMEIAAEDEPQKDGFDFSGWSDVPDVMPNHDVTVSGTFSSISLAVNHEHVTNGRTVVSDLTGRPLRYVQRGLNIVRQNGKVRKVFIKN